MLANVGHLCVLVMDALLGIQSNGEMTQDHKAVQYEKCTRVTT